MKKINFKGIYEYIIARTKYIDSALERNSEKIEQILIFGAGFDSRSIRFKDKLKHTSFFELDSKITQNAKIQQFKDKNIQLPNNVVYIPIDFTKDLRSQKLDEYGFKRDKVCLFILEGLTMYLDIVSVDSTFNLISEYAGKGSIILFDYICASVLKQENTSKDNKKIYNSVLSSGEKWNFGIDKGDISNFLLKYNFQLEDEANSKTLERRYFINSDGKLVGHVNGVHSLVTAIK